MHVVSTVLSFLINDITASTYRSFLFICNKSNFRQWILFQNKGVWHTVLFLNQAVKSGFHSTLKKNKYTIHVRIYIHTHTATPYMSEMHHQVLRLKTWLYRVYIQSQALPFRECIQASSRGGGGAVNILS